MSLNGLIIKLNSAFLEAYLYKDVLIQKCI